MPRRNLQITVHDWSAEDQKAIKAFYSLLTQAWNQMTPWYKTEPMGSTTGIQRCRDAMRFGRDGWPAKTYLNEIAQNISIPSRSGNNSLSVRMFQPPKTKASPKGVYMHMHGGGWTLGAADGQDGVLYRIAKNTGHVVASVEYRLAPEHPFPASVDDCIDVALHLLSPKFVSKYGSLRVIGGESAGAHLTMTVTLALRELGYDVRTQLDAIVLNYGCYDVSQTPSSRAAQNKLVLSSIDVQEFNSAWLPGAADLQRPAISPLFNPNFTNLPPAIFIVGSDDALYDDSLFGAIKWHMGGNETQLVVFPGSVHGFCRLGGPDAEAALATSEAFLLKHSRPS